MNATRKPKPTAEARAVARALRAAAFNRGVEAAYKAVPKTWLDELLSGKGSELRGTGGDWGCRNVEWLLTKVGERIRARKVLGGRKGRGR